MGAQGRINGIASVDQLFLPFIVEALETGRGRGERRGAIERARQHIGNVVAPDVAGMPQYAPLREARLGLPTVNRLISATIVRRAKARRDGARRAGRAR